MKGDASAKAGAKGAKLPPVKGSTSPSKAPAAAKGATDERATMAVTSGVGSGSLDNISLATYVCDFGNVVAGATKRKSFRLTNVGRLPVNFNFDKKVLTQAGIAIEPDKVQKVAPNCSTLFHVAYATRKNAKLGRVRWLAHVDIKGGPSYSIEFIANLTIPELSMSTENLDFGKVCVQTRKTVKIRFENEKEVPCDWQFHHKPDIAAAATAAKEGERFQVYPISGTLLPGQR